MTRIERAEEIVGLLQEAEITATRRIGAVAALAPCVVVVPPVIDWAGEQGATMGAPSVTWSVHAVAGTGQSDDAWETIDALVSQVAEVLNVERAVPSAFAVGEITLPAYTMTITENVED